MTFRALQCVLEKQSSEKAPLTPIAFEAETPEALIELLRGANRHGWPSVSLISKENLAAFKQVSAVVDVGIRQHGQQLTRYFLKKETRKQLTDGVIPVVDGLTYQRQAGVTKAVNAILANMRGLKDAPICLLAIEKALFDQYYRNRRRDDESLTLAIPPELRKKYIGASPLAEKVREDIVLAANRDDVSVLILGETGTGKEIVAQWIYQLSARKGKGGRIQAVNCAAIPSELLESELFGTAPGAYTGASKQIREGHWELAHEGILFLDEIGDIATHHQAKVLQALETGGIYRVGAPRLKIEVDARVISATHRELTDEVARGRFREDLYYRLSRGVTIRLPSLRHHPQVIPEIAKHLWARYAAAGKFPELPNDILDELARYPWPGNVRQLDGILADFSVRYGKKPTRVTDLRAVLELRHAYPRGMRLSLHGGELAVREPSRLDWLAEADRLVKYLIGTIPAWVQGVRKDRDSVPGVVRSVEQAEQELRELLNEGQSSTRQDFLKVNDISGHLVYLKNVIQEAPKKALDCWDKEVKGPMHAGEEILRQQLNRLMQGVIDADEVQAVTLPDEVMRLAEGLARHNHIVWMKRRISEGWTWGPTWDGENKQNPDLVDYDKLSDSEKQYSRDAAIGMLKAIIALGFAIERE
jgi:DNA-binding NtrC family response regulator